MSLYSVWCFTLSLQLCLAACIADTWRKSVPLLKFISVSPQRDPDALQRIGPVRFPLQPEIQFNVRCFAGAFHLLRDQLGEDHILAFTAAPYSPGPVFSKKYYIHPACILKALLYSPRLYSLPFSLGPVFSTRFTRPQLFEAPIFTRPHSFSPTYSLDPVVSHQNIHPAP